MATEPNNILTNSFLKGMNTDASRDTIGADSYIFGQNIRITTNTLLLSISDSNSTEGIVSPVPAGDVVKTDNIYSGDYSILATASIENIGAVIIAKGNKWYVYRIDFNENPIKFSLLFESEETLDIKNKFSVVINREVENVVKLYIADGIHQLMQINLLDDSYNKRISGNTDNITSNRIYPSVQANIVKLISGSLKTSLVQYTYRLYKKYGISSRLAPLTNKIQIIDPNRNKEEGNAEDTTASIGLLIKIPMSKLNINKTIFDHVLIYRVSYIKAQEDATVELIYDSFIKQDDLIVNDNGYTSLKELSIDEFSAINSMVIVPQNIELTQGYLFASNIKDETIIRIGDDNGYDNPLSQIDSRAYLMNTNNLFVLRRGDNPLEGEHLFRSVAEIKQASVFDVNVSSIINEDSANINSAYLPCMYTNEGGIYYYGGEGANIKYKLVTTPITIHDKFDILKPNPPYSTGNQPHSPLYYIDSAGKLMPSNLTSEDYLKQHGITAMQSLEYDDIIGSSMFRSLRRDEVYRYGVIYYDRYGRRSDVQWIGDIKTPNLKNVPNIHRDRSSSASERSITSYIDSYVYFDVHGVENGAYYMHYSYWQKTIKSGPWRIKKGNNVRLQLGNTSMANSTIDEFNRQLSGYMSATVNCALVIDDQYYAPGLSVNVTKDSDVYVLFNRLDVSGFDYSITPPDYFEPGNNTVYFRGDYSESDLMERLHTTYAVIKAFGERHGGTVDTHHEDLEGVGLDLRINFSIDISSQDLTTFDMLQALPLGLEFNVSVPKSTGITSYQIVRCSKSTEYSKYIMLGALTRPIQQSYSANSTTKTLKSPFYPTPFMSSQYFLTPDYLQGTADNLNNNRLFQIHSSEISIFPEDSLSLIHKNDSKLDIVKFSYEDTLLNISYALSGYRTQDVDVLYRNKEHIEYNRHRAYGASGDAAIEFKEGSTCNMYLYKDTNDYRSASRSILLPKKATIEEVSSVLVPTWEQGFSNIQLSGSAIIAGVKAYKSYVSTVKTDEYVNWICNGMYNLRIGSYESQSGLNDGDEDDFRTKTFTYLKAGDGNVEYRSDRASGWIGPGPQCILVRVNEDEDNKVLYNSITCPELDYDITIGSLICNIQHTAQQFAGFSSQEKLFDIYYGFGNYGTLTEDNDGNMTGSVIVFDGDVYNLPCELVTMYKTYNFNSIKDTLPSAQIVNYVPLETKINTFFDYGMNYRNTQSPNLLVEPGEITGVCSLDRPQHQYNPIYSDNNLSNDVYNAQSEEYTDQTFSLRIFYSQLKTNGEVIDNWSDFRALDYIDADTRYGKITHMLTSKDIIYFWLSGAFGKLSVNERSLVTDNNNNTIQLGQGGVLQRTDYIDTTHGLRENDRSAISTNSGIFWIDVFNKAILLNLNSQVLNYGERLNVQNVINENMNDDVPEIDFDQLNEELLCKCFSNNRQLVFNTKLNCATSVYTRDYSNIIYYNNVVYGLTNDSKMIKYNYLSDQQEYLKPTVLSFVVNQIPSATKVFDNQQIVTMKRSYDENFAEVFMKNKIIEFSTNLDNSSYKYNTTEVITDREGNINYCIPRINNSKYGNRLRGRWMNVTMIDEDPKYEYSISHVLTKFRQSFN